MKTPFFTTRKAAPGVTLIEGVSHEYCYLVEGTRKALLIDTLAGVGDLAAFCRGLNQLPLTVINTHGHYDHIGGNAAFDEYYLSPLDDGLVEGNSQVEVRWHYVEGQTAGEPHHPWTRDDLLPPRRLKRLPLFEGMQFDLGDRGLEVVATPGHTPGSVCLLDRGTRSLFAGDTANTNTLLHLPESTTVARYHKSIQKLQTLRPSIDRLFICHENTPLPPSCLDDLDECCRLVLTGKDDQESAVMIGRPCLYAKRRGADGTRKDGHLGNLAYDPSRIKGE